MMGKQASPACLFYDFRLDDHTPADHLLRQMDIFLDLEQTRQELTPFYSSIGHPSVDPELMIRMLIVGYSFGIRSERRLREEVHLNEALASKSAPNQPLTKPAKFIDPWMGRFPRRSASADA